MSSTTSSMREQHRGHHYFLFDQEQQQQLHNSPSTVNPCFIPGGRNSPAMNGTPHHTDRTSPQLAEEPANRHLALPREPSDRARQYFELEKGEAIPGLLHTVSITTLLVWTSHHLLLSSTVYEEMVRGAHAIPQVTTSHNQPPPPPPPPPPHSQQYLERQRRVLQQPTDPLNSSDNHYVNPRPGVSLINPDHKTVERMKRLGLDPESQTPSTPKEYSEPKFIVPHQYQIVVNK